MHLRFRAVWMRALLLTGVAAVVGAFAGFLIGTRSSQSDAVYSTGSDIPYVQEAYAIARARSDLLAKLPCLCGCSRKTPAHQNVLDCFKSEHAESCTVCIETAKYAERAAREGRTVDEMKRYLHNVYTFDTH